MAEEVGNAPAFGTFPSHLRNVRFALACTVFFVQILSLYGAFDDDGDFE